MGFNLADYDAAVREFSRAQARGWLDGLPGGRGLNIAHEAVDRHAAGPRRDAVALRCIAKDDQVTELTYGDLAGQTSRFANLLGELGVGKGDRVFSVLGRVPELYIAALGTLKNTSVFSPLFPAFGPEPIQERLRLTVAEAGVIGKPDPVAGEIVKAFVALKPGWEPSEELRRGLAAGDVSTLESAR